MKGSNEVRTRRPTPYRRNIAKSTVVAAVLAASLVGCDTATDDTVVLSGIRSNFRFEFDGSDLVVGEDRDVQSTDEASIALQLSNRGGFTLDEIVAARVASVSIELVQPTFVGSGIDLRFLDDVLLQLKPGSMIGRDVASRSGFTDEEPADLNVIQGRDISTVVKSGSFSAFLQLRPNDLIDTNYVLEVVVEFTVEVEGV